MLDVLLGVNGASGLSSYTAPSIGLAWRSRRPQQAERLFSSAPGLSVVCGRSKGKGKASKPVRPAPPAPQVLFGCTCGQENGRKRFLYRVLSGG